MRKGVVVTIVLGIFGLAVSAMGATWHVPGDFGTIQEAINASTAGDSVLVAPGTYNESLQFGATPVVVMSTDGPLVTRITNSPTVDLAVFINSPATTVLTGFTLDNGHIAIWCREAAPTIRGNVIKNQQITNWAAVVFSGPEWATAGPSPVTFIGNTIMNSANGGISSFSTVPAIIKNTIIVNCAYGVHNQGWLHQVVYTEPPILSYNDVYNCGADYYNCPDIGVGTIAADPQFATPFGQLGPTSPCIDAGDPDPIYNDPDGTRNDMGALAYEPIEPRTPGTFYVPDDYATVSEAVEYAVDDDTILVRPGTYIEHVMFYGRSIVLKSTHGPRATVLRFPPDRGATYNDGVLVLGPGSDNRTLIEGFTLDGSGRTNGVSCTYSNPTVRHCVVQNCVGSYDGGGFWLDHCRPTVEFNIIRNNRTSISGGGVFIRLGNADGQARITDNVIYGNTAGNAGGIIAIEGRGAYIARNLVYSNTVRSPNTEGEGAVIIRGDDCVILNNTIADNYAGITLVACNNADIRNNIVAGGLFGIRANDFVGSSQAVLAYNDFWANATSYVNVTPGPTDLSVDPLFVSCGYALSGQSPCIDAGDPDALYNDPDGSRNDLGALPYDPNQPQGPRTIRVPADVASIQDAIEMAGCMDTVLVSPGEYHETLNFGGKSLVLRSEGGAELTRLLPPFAPIDSKSSTVLNTQRVGTDGAESPSFMPGVLINLTPGSDNLTVIDGFTLNGADVAEGVHCLESDPTITNCVIEHCVGAYDGGGLWFQHCSPLVINNVIRYNHTRVSGGGIFVRMGYGYHPRFVGNEIYGNVGGNGGGIVAIEGEGATIERNLIYDNHVEPKITQGWGAVTIRGDNCKVVNNTIVANDGGVSIIYSINLDVRNNIIVNNLAGGLIRNDYAGTPINFTHEYNDVWANNDKDFVLLEPGLGEISVDPQFLGTINPGEEHAASDFFLALTSLCIDAGDPNTIYNDPDESRNDMGAFPASQPTAASHDQANQPLVFGLEQNYPNPCNPSTMISFSLPTPAHVTLTIFNLLGQEVCPLVDGELSAGIHRVEWNGRDQNGQTTATGIYFYRLTAGSDEQTKKLLMLK